MSKSPETVRHGGPGASDQNAKHGPAPKHNMPGTNQVHSSRSGGGGEEDKHHSHDPKLKGGSGSKRAPREER